MNARELIQAAQEQLIHGPGHGDIGANALARGVLDVLGTANPTAARMFATLVSAPPAMVGDLVCVFVPDNCTVHSIDAERLCRMRQLVNSLSRQRRTRQPVSSTQIAELFDLSEQLDG